MSNQQASIFGGGSAPPTASSGPLRMTTEDFVRANPGIDLEQLKAQLKGGPPPVGTVTHGEMGTSTFALGAPEDWQRGDDIFLAASEGVKDKVVAMLDAGAPVDKQDGEGRTALHWACDRGHVDLVQILLGRGASLSLQDGAGQSALHYSVACEHVEIIKLLVAAGSDINMADTDGDTPLSLAGKKIKPLLVG